MSKIKNLKNELRGLAVSDLEQKVEMLRRDLFSMRLQAITNPVKDVKQFSRIRKDIARAITILDEKRFEEFVTQIAAMVNGEGNSNE